MKTSYTVNGYHFKWNDNAGFYECRGSIHYDHEGDEIPEPGLWKAANELANKLSYSNYRSEWSAEHSEKGWCEVVKD